MLEAVQEAALVEAAVFILFDRGILCNRWRGKQQGCDQGQSARKSGACHVSTVPHFHATKTRGQDWATQRRIGSSSGAIGFPLPVVLLNDDAGTEDCLND